MLRVGIGKLKRPKAMRSIPSTAHLPGFVWRRRPVSAAVFGCGGVLFIMPAVHTDPGPAYEPDCGTGPHQPTVYPVHVEHFSDGRRTHRYPCYTHC